MQILGMTMVDRVRRDRTVRAMRLLALVLLTVVLAAGETRIDITTSLGVIRCRLFDEATPLTVRTFADLAEGRREFTDLATGQAVKRPYFDGLTFHRVVPGFMIQGGDPKGDGTGGPGFSFKDEINAVSLGLDREKVLTGQVLHPQCQHMQPQFYRAYILPRLQARGLGPTSTQAEVNAALGAILPQLQAITLLDFYRDLGYAYDAALPASRRPVRGVIAMANSGANTNGSQFFILVGDAPHLTGKHTVFGEVVEGMAVADAIAAVPRGERDRPNEPVRIVSIREAKTPAP